MTETEADSMARWSKVDRRVWNDQRFRKLSAAQPNAQTLWFRVLFGPELGPIPGLFSAWEAGLAQALKWPLEAFRKRFQELLQQGMAKADWEAGLVWVPNAIRFNSPANPNVVKSWGNAWDELPECALKVEAYHTLKQFTKGLGEGFQKAFAITVRNHMPIQEQEQEQEQEIPSPTSKGSARARARETESATDDASKGKLSDEARAAMGKHISNISDAMGPEPTVPPQTSPETRRSAPEPGLDPSEPTSAHDGSQAAPVGSRGCCRRCGKLQDRYRGDGKLCSACHRLGKELSKHDGLSPGIHNQEAQTILEALLSHPTLDGIGDRAGVANYHTARLGLNSSVKPPLTVERVVECIGLVAQEAEDEKLATGQLKEGGKCVTHLRRLAAMHGYEYEKAKDKVQERARQAEPKKRERYVPPSGPVPRTRRATLEEQTGVLPGSFSSSSSEPVSLQQRQRLLQNLGGDLALKQSQPQSVARTKSRPAVKTEPVWCDSCEVNTHSNEDCTWFKEQS